MRLALGALAVAVLVAFVVVVAGEDDSAGPERGLSLRELLDDPGQHLGDVVTVSGEVARLDGRRGAFTIGDRTDAQENELFVASVQATGFDAGRLREESVVRVTGEVRRITERERQDDPLFDDTEDDAFDEFEGELAVDAERVEIVR